MKIELLFSRTRWGFLSWIIRKVLDFEWSHIAIKYDSKVYEADWIGVVENEFFEYENPKYEYVLKELKLEENETEKFIEFIRSKIGQKYDYFLLIGNVLSRIIHRPRTGKGLWNNAYQNTCSELISEGLKMLGYQLGIDPSQITPKEIWYLELRK